MTQPQLVRSTTLVGAVLLGLGAIIGTGAYVSVALATSMTGSAVLWAILLAALVAVCNGLSSAQLAAAHPVSGGTYEYGYTYLNPAFGFTAGWLFVAAKSASAATAALALSLYILPALGLPDVWQLPLAWLAVIVMTLLVLSGLRRSNQANLVIVAISIGALLVFIVTTLLADPVLTAESASADTVPVTASIDDVLAAAALLFVAYTGYGRIATMGEEVSKPQQTIPRAIIITLLVTTALYLLLGWALQSGTLEQRLAAVEQAGDESALALVNLAQNETVATIMLVGAAVALLGVMLNLILGVSRVVLAMARRSDLPPRLAQLNEARTSAPAAVLVTAVVMLVLVSLGRIDLAWSFSAFTVLVYYGITNLAALQLPASDRFVPRWVAWTGLFSCLGLAVFVTPGVLVTGCAFIALGLLWQQWRNGKGE